MPFLAAVMLVVPLVWPARFVGPDATCFSPEADALPVIVAPPPALPVDAIPAEPEAPSAPPAPPAAPDPVLRTPVAVAVWGEIALVTLPVEDAI